jgi:hypothetical protein
MIVLSEREQQLLLDVPREKLTRLLSYLGSFLGFPLLVALVVGMLEQSATIGIKTFLLTELGMAVLSPLLNTVIASGERKPDRHRGR